MLPLSYKKAQQFLTVALFCLSRQQCVKKGGVRIGTDKYGVVRRESVRHAVLCGKAAQYAIRLSAAFFCIKTAAVCVPYTRSGVNKSVQYTEKSVKVSKSQ